MPRKEGQTRKLLVLLQILLRETDEKHPLSVPQLVEKLQEHGVEAERKSVLRHKFSDVFFKLYTIFQDL